MIKVKICAIRNLEAAQVAVDSGADFLGFVFVKNSARYIDPEEAKKIIKKLKGRIQFVGVFKKTSKNEINQLVEKLHLDFVQLHDFGSPYFCKQINAKVIRSFGLESDFNIEAMESTFKKYSVPYFHLDRKRRGEGKVISFKKAKAISEKFPVFFSGGLTPENVVEAVKIVQPFAVDVSSGIETNGLQGLEKIIKFITNAKGVAI